MSLAVLCVRIGAESSPPEKPVHPVVRELSSHFPEKPSIAPSATIPLEPLGFAPPGRELVGMRYALASLDFLGEDRLLFTFRVPSLMQREPGSTGQDQRQIRAIVLALPSGAIQTETNWTLHDRSRYILALDDNHFLLRDRNTIFEGDAGLNRKPVLQFPGPLLSMQLNPGQQYIVTNSSEPPQSASATAESAVAAPANARTAAGETANEPELVLRILQRDTHKVLLVTHVHNAFELPLNSEGFLSAQHANGNEWGIDLNYFTGPNRTLSTIKSACTPQFDFLSEQQALVSVCSDGGDSALTALTTAGATLWTILVSDRQVWPLITPSRNGLRFVHQSLYVTHAVNAFNPLGTDDIKGQWIRVLDSATGDLAFETTATPILDAGGNVAISPSGRRVAVINAGSIQIFELPPPPALPATATVRPAP